MSNTNSEGRRKLNLKNVTDVIGKSFLNWHPGDFVIIESQTGTGKTYFVEMTLIKHFIADSILYVCNRKNLERQIKRDVLKIKERKIPDTIDELDKLPSIDNVTITTYQAIQSHILDDEYYEESFAKNYRYYNYIILDECHYILSDSSFNNTTRLAFNEFIRFIDMGPIKVFMSATTHEIKGPLI